MDAMQTIDVRKFKTLFPDYMDTEMDNDFFIADFDLGYQFHTIEYPCRVDGYVAFFCVSGDLDIDINLQTFHVKKNTLLVNVPGNIFRISRQGNEPVRLLVVAISKDFFSSINVDFNNLFNESMGVLSDPCVVLDEAELELLRHYFLTAKSIMVTELGNKREILGSLISSVFYLFSSIWSKHLAIAHQGSREKSTRAKAIFEDFLKLVTEYHVSERTVGFYADKLYLTPKYLSKIIKSVSGISAPDWINSFIVLEAKNMLKYSDLTISEIVYKLNFTSQSVFYKFFKGQTGLTPSEYRKM